MQVYKPGSVSARRIPIIYLALTLLSGSNDLPILPPEGNDEQPLRQNLFGLSTRKVYHATVVTNRPVSSYLTISPLPRQDKVFVGVVYFLLHSLSLISHPINAFPLGSTVLCVARTFLSHASVTAIGRLAQLQNYKYWSNEILVNIKAGELELPFIGLCRYFLDDLLEQILSGCISKGCRLNHYKAFIDGKFRMT